MPGIEHGLQPTFWDGEPRPQFTHLDNSRTYDTEPDHLAEQNLAADEKMLEAEAEKRRKASEGLQGIATSDVVEFTD